MRRTNQSRHVWIHDSRENFKTGIAWLELFRLQHGPRRWSGMTAQQVWPKRAHALLDAFSLRISLAAPSPRRSAAPFLFSSVHLSLHILFSLLCFHSLLDRIISPSVAACRFVAVKECRPDHAREAQACSGRNPRLRCGRVYRHDPKLCQDKHA